MKTFYAPLPTMRRVWSAHLICFAPTSHGTRRSALLLRGAHSKEKNA
jgi:hypothetical protein